ncbi:MAG: CDP-glucose 4,6-dehydratase, partial [Bacteroidota bacterium]
VRADIRDFDTLRKTYERHRPDYVFHLAAQPIVRRGFTEPVYTIETNVVGTMNVLETLRVSAYDCIAILITTDKVYENVEWVWAYRENDALGGHDPYSASKSCAEVLISTYQRSFFEVAASDAPKIHAASVRGGNVIGGGDWAKDRIVPDSIRSLSESQPIPVRNRKATRPWQHVLELLSGYLHLGSQIHAARTASDHDRLAALCSPFNFGPNLTSNRSVEALVTEILKHWPGEWTDFTPPDARHEAGKLNLTIDKAYHALGWQPQWGFEETIRHLAEWYRSFYADSDPSSVQALTQGQIRAYAKGLAY